MDGADGLPPHQGGETVARRRQAETPPHTGEVHGRREEVKITKNMIQDRDI